MLVFGAAVVCTEYPFGEAVEGVIGVQWVLLWLTLTICDLG